MAMVAEGKPAPDFELPSSQGGTLRLASLRGTPVVLYFYPRDNTPGCTREACAFRDKLSVLRRAGALVLGVSPDSLDAHGKFRADHRLNFPLLSDPDKKVARAYGAFGKKVMYGRQTQGIIRSTFLIDADGIVRKVFPRVKVDGHAQEVLEALRVLARGR